MKFALTIASFVASALAVNSFTAPLGNVPLIAGDSTVISWNNAGGGSKVDLFLKKGKASDLSTVMTIAKAMPNQGKALWDIPTSIPTGHYALEIVEVDSSGSEVAHTANYSPRFQIINNSTITSSSSSSSAAPTSTAVNTTTAVTSTPSMAVNTSTVVSSSVPPTTKYNVTTASVSSSSVPSSSSTVSSSSTSSSASATTSSKSNGASTLQLSSLVAGAAVVGAAFFAF